MKLKQFIVSVSNWLNRNTGFLIVVAIVAFGLAIVGFQKDNQLILEDTHDTVDNTELLLERQAKEQEARGEAVKRIIAANTRSDEQQTMILCTLILRGQLVITDEEAIQIEQICEEEIQRFQDRGAQSNTSNGTTPTQSDQFSNGGQSSQQSNGQSLPSTSPPPSNPPNETPPPPPPPEDRTTIGNILRDVQEVIRDLSCGALGVFC